MGDVTANLGFVFDLLEKRLEIHRRDYNPGQTWRQARSRRRFNFRNLVTWCTMHRVAPRVDYASFRETVQQMVVIEQATLAEYEAVLPLLERFFAEEGFDTPQAKIAAELAELIGASSSVVFLARQGERAVGVATVTTTRGIELGISAELEDLYVVPDARGVGVGALLIEAVKDWCRSRGCSLVAVVVTPEGQVAHDLVAYYRRQGFEETGRMLLFAQL